MKIILPLQPALGRLCCLIGALMAHGLSASAAIVNVSVVNNSFVPSSVTVNANDQVTWTWAPADGVVPHTTTSDTGGLWDSGIQMQPFSFTHAFPSAGSFPYHCTIHAAFGMRGTVTVQPGSVNQPPDITTQPASQTVSSGADAVFTVAATGTPPLSYQWKKNGTAISGATDASLTLHAVSTSDEGNYSVTVSNPAGATTSAEAVLTVQPGGMNQPPDITTQPASQTVNAGADAVFTVAATGTPPLSYQWKKNGAEIPGATDASLTLHAVSTSDEGNYSVTVSNPAGSTTSAEAVLTVQPGGMNQPPLVTTQPASQTVNSGADAVFTVAATGTPPLSYQWKKNGAEIPGATDASLTLHAVTTSDDGNYSVTVSSSAGATTSAAATLTVQSGGNVSLVAGNYSGLFFVPDAVAQSSSGTVSLKTTAKGKFSGSLQTGPRHIPLSGQFDNTGAATKTISAKGATPLTVVLQVDPNDTDRITGSVSDGQFTAQLLANRAVFDGRQQTAPQAGLYTITIAGSEDSSAAPGGDSVATARVDKAAKISMAGSLADGTRFTQTAVLSKHGDWPFYVALYSGQGSILGWLTFAGTGPGDISGNVAWIKPSTPKARFYPAGFKLNTTASGSHYVPPTAGNNVLTLADAVLMLSGGGLAQDISQPVKIGPKNKVTDANGRKLSFTFAPSTGTFNGQAVNPGTQKPVSLNGVVLQALNSGTGYFLGSSQSGKVTLTAP